jgi:hypothetical protein
MWFKELFCSSRPGHVRALVDIGRRGPMSFDALITRAYLLHV